MNNPVVLYNLMIHAIQYKEFEEAYKYAQELDDIVGYRYYVDYVESQEIINESNKDKCLIRYNKFIEED